MYKKYVKRTIDIVLSLICIIVLLPIYVIISILVGVSMGAPVLYKQERIGLNETSFNLYKYRSMTNETDENGVLLPEHLRITKVGAFLRSSSLDELPELFLILFGKMSFVGPRPLPAYYLPYYEGNERRRHEVKGGLIPVDGLSRKAVTTWEEQFQYEIEYVNSISFGTDVKVIMCTLGILLERIKSNYGSEDRPHLNEYRKNKA